MVPKVFISYSWDSKAHKQWVLNLATRLRRNGIDVRLDRWDLKPGASLTQFMEIQLHECDFILVICTPNYFGRSLKRIGGVGYEQQIISGQIASGINRERFIPILRDGDFRPGPGCGIPTHFSGTYAIDYRKSANKAESFEETIRALYVQPSITRPKLGRSPFKSRTSRPRLPTVDLDGYELVSGSAQNVRHPKTFHVPAPDKCAQLVVGDLVKLMFELRPKGGESSCERMWVIITKVNAPYYVGKLNNVPANADTKLRSGSVIQFLAEHVINIGPNVNDVPKKAV